MRKIGEYSIRKAIAVGGQAEIYLGEMEGPGGFVLQHALKMLKRPLGGRRAITHPEGRALIGEARLLARLAHPHTLSIHGLREHDDRLYMVLEYVTGRSLAHLLGELRRRRNVMPIEHALWIARCSLLALHRAHTLLDERGNYLSVVHRDISPENVLLGFDSRVKLIDFGIAISRLKARDTRVGVVKGKLEYMSPEQALGVDVDHHTDIYSMGLVLYEMLTGIIPLAGDPVTALDRARNPKILPARRHAPSLPVDVEKILSRALARRPEDRYASARDMMLECVRVLHVCNPHYVGDELGDYLRLVLADAHRTDRAPRRREGTAVMTSHGGVPPADQTHVDLAEPSYAPGTDEGRAAAAPRQPPPIPAEARAMARRIDPRDSSTRVYNQQEQHIIESEADSDPPTRDSASLEEQPDLGELLQAIEDIYDRRAGRLQPEDDDEKPADAHDTRVFKRH